MDHVSPKSQHDASPNGGVFDLERGNRSQTLKDYYNLTKPGIVRGNLVSATAGFFFATRSQFDLTAFFYMFFGLGFIIASSCVLNNYTDRFIDAKMGRTKERALASGRIHLRGALLYAFILGFVGATLLLAANPLSLTIAMLGVFFYVIVYSFFKRRTPLGTLIGSISGAVPPVVGYTASSNQVDLGALFLFLILTFWQMPHFYAISIYEKKNYAASSIPVLSVKKGVFYTKKQIILFIEGFVLVSLLPFLFGYAGIIYFVCIIFVGTKWLYRGLFNVTSKSSKVWAKKMFGESLLALLVIASAIILEGVLRIVL